jgi:hypothetical protein
MRFKGALALLVISVLVGGVYFLIVLPSQREAERKKELREKIFAAEIQEIDEIRLANQGEHYKLTKEDGTWLITAPRRLLADRRIITKIVESLNEERIIKVVSTDLKRKSEFGLTMPVIYAAFGHGGKVDHFFIGPPSPAASGAYLYKGGLEGIFLVSMDVAGALNQNLYGLRRKEPFILDEALPVRKIVIERNTDTIEIHKAGTGWTVVNPLKGRGSDDDVAALIKAIRYLRADEFFDDMVPDPSDYSKTSRIRIFSGDREIILDVHFWGTSFNEGLMVYQHGQKYSARTTQREFWNLINQGADFFQYRNLFSFDINDAYQITGNKGGERVSLQKRNGAWYFEDREITEERVTELLEKMNTLKAGGIADKKDYAGGEEYFSLVLKGARGETVSRLSVYGETGSSNASFDPQKGKLVSFFAESSNLEYGCIVTNHQIDDLFDSLKKIVAGEIA